MSDTDKSQRPAAKNQKLPKWLKTATKKNAAKKAEQETAPKRPVLKLWSGHVVEALSGALAVLLFLSAVSAWYFAHGTLSLNVVRPNIEDALRKSLTSADIEFDDISIRQSSEGSLANIAITGLRFDIPRNDITATIPQADMTLKVTGLLRGRLEPRRIIVPEGTLISHLPDQDGAAAKPAPAAASKSRAADPARLLATLIAPFFPENAADGTALASLESIELNNIHWQQPSGQGLEDIAQIRSKFERTADHAVLDLDASFVVTGAEPLALAATAVRQREQPFVYASFSTTETELNHTLGHLRALTGLTSPLPERITLPLVAAGQTRIDQHGQILDADLSISVTDGVFDYEGVTLAKQPAPDPDNPLDALQPKRPLPRMEKIALETAEAQLAYDAAGRTLSVSRIYAAAGDNRIDWAGTVTFPGKMGTDDAPLKFALGGTQTRLKIAGIYPELVILDHLDLSGTYDFDDATLQLDNLALGIDNGTLVLSGEIAMPAEGAKAVIGDAEQFIHAPHIRAHGELTAIQLASVVKLWPNFVGLGARDWIRKNITSGHVTTGTLDVDIPENYLGRGPLQNDMLTLAFAFKDGKANYIPGLTPMENITGTARMEGNKFELWADPGAAVGKVKVTDGYILMPQLVPKGAVSEYSASIEGKTQEILTLIDMDPLNLMSDFGLDPKRLGGNAKVSFTIGRPNRRRVPSDLLQYKASASSKNLSLANAFGDKDLTNGDIAVDIAKTGITGKGSMDLGGVPVNLVWNETFNAAPNPSTRYTISFNQPAQMFAKWGVSLDKLMQGSVSGTVKTVGDGPKIYSADIAFDLTETQIMLPQMEWRKPRRQKASLKLAGNLPKSPRQNLNWTVNGTAPDFDLRGKIKLAGDYRLLDADFAKLQIGKQTDLTLTAHRRSRDDGLEISVTGTSLVAGELLENLNGGGSSSFDTPVALNAAVDKVFLKQDVLIQNTNLALELNGGKLIRFNLETDFPGEGGLYGGLTEFEWGERKLAVSSTDAGRVIAGLTGSSSFIGGDLDLVVDLPADGSKSIGDLEIRDFRVINLPLLARILSAGSLQGMSDLLNGEGLAFKRMEVDFSLNDGQVVIDKGQASGDSLGLTAQGYFDQGQNRIGIRGTIVPIYSVNRILGYVPIIGNIFTSREGEGLLGFTYHVKGPLDEAQISVNPLSALAPGFLRRLFQLGDDTKPPKPEDRDPATLPETQADGAGDGAPER